MRECTKARAWVTITNQVKTQTGCINLKYGKFPCISGKFFPFGGRYVWSFGMMNRFFLPACCSILLLFILPFVSAAKPLDGFDSHVYKTIGDVELKLFIKAPDDAKADQKRPAVVFFFGGGWNGGTPEQFAPHCNHLASKGIIGVTAEYRVKSRHKTTPDKCVEDGKSAVRWLRANAKKLGIDPERLGAGGGSAGGHVAAATGNCLGFEVGDVKVSSKPVALLLFNPVYNNGPGKDGWGHSRVEAYWQKISPAHNIRKGAPPTIVFLGTKDPLIPVRVAENYEAEMKKVGSTCVTHLYEGRPHGFFNESKGGGKDYRDTLVKVDAFLAKIGWLDADGKVVLAAGPKGQGSAVAKTATKTTKPNLIFILADDLGYGDLGCFGQELIKTPRLDRMAREGMMLTDFYAGSTVCAPSRSVLMTGQHMGHTHVRGNAGHDLLIQSLRTEDLTVAEVLKQAGYATALFGKWGLGEVGQPGHPMKKGFDTFYGYLNQVHAHNFYPTFLWRGLEKEMLRNEVKLMDRTYAGFTGGSATKRVDYTHDLFAKETLNYIRSHAHDKPAQPFFLYMPLTIPHANNEATKMVGDGAEVPDYGIYADQDWPNQDKGQAAMITRMDADVGRILDLLTELDIANNTLVMFTSDNGPHNEAGHNPERFKPAGPLTGMKRNLTEGGIRVPTLAWWPGKIAPGTSSDHVAYFGDLMATAAELAGATDTLPSDGLDSLSFLPALTGGEQVAHDYLYWEFYERVPKQAVRSGKWKAIRQPMITGKMKLYNLESDLAETTDIAAEHPDVVKRLAAYLDQAHTPHPNWNSKPR